MALGESIETLYAQRRRPVLFIGWAIAMVAAWSIRFVQDDAFISFRYAKNLVHGHGLVLNPGERVEGYTNFLWTLLMAVPEVFGWSTPLFSQLAGMVVFGITIVLVFQLARRVMDTELHALFATVFALANASFLGYATGGLETMLVTCWLMATLNLLAGRHTTDPTAVRRELAAGVIGGLAVLTRLDSALLIGATWVLYLVMGTRADAGTAHTPDRTSVGSTIRSAVAPALRLGLPMLVIVLPWFIWKLDYYGSLLPNTMVAKEAGSRTDMLAGGVKYLWIFVSTYAAVLLVDRLWFARRELVASPIRRQLFALIPLSCLYVIYVGGDFMEFRFLVPVIPIMAMLAVLLLVSIEQWWRVTLTLVIMAIMSVGHLTSDLVSVPVAPFSMLRTWPAQANPSLTEHAYELHRLFPDGIYSDNWDDGEDKVVIAVGALGVVSYFSELETVDLIGLTDAYVAEHGELATQYYPAHTKMAPIDYLLERNVDLISPAWYFVVADPDRTEYRLSEVLGTYPVVDLKERPASMQVLEIPIPDTDFAWPMLSLGSDPTIDAMIEDRGWRTFPITDECRVEDVAPLTYRWGSRSCDFTR